MALDPKRTVAELKELRSLTGDANGAQRVAWTDTWLSAREWFASKLRDLPVAHHYDSAGNNWVTLAGASEKSLLIGGHLDSVPNGGWLDGCLGVLDASARYRRDDVLGRRIDHVEAAAIGGFAPFAADPQIGRNVGEKIVVHGHGHILPYPVIAGLNPAIHAAVRPHGCPGRARA